MRDYNDNNNNNNRNEPDHSTVKIKVIHGDLWRISIAQFPVKNVKNS